jgi:hypothetical protein
VIVTKKVLPRRTFLRGAGVTLGLPFLSAMVPAMSALRLSAATNVRRLGFFYLPNGVGKNHSGIDYWNPPGQGTSLELSPILNPLTAFKNQMVVISGLTQSTALQGLDGNGDHTRSTSTWLSGVRPRKTQGADLRGGTTADQLAAERLGRDTVLPSLEIAAIDIDFLVGQCENGYSCAYTSTLAWRTPTTPLPAAGNPRVVFEQLFGAGGSADQRVARLQKRSSILDAVVKEISRLERTLGPEDRARSGEYLEAVREIERRIQKSEAWANDTVLPSPAAGIPTGFTEHAQLLFDLLWLAYQADITRVCTFMLGRELNNRTFPEIGVNESHHSISHHSDNPEQITKLMKINVLQSQLFAAFLEKLRATPEGDGNLLDHALLLYGAGMSNPNVHSHQDLPLFLVGGSNGQLQGGRHLEYPIDTPMTNLLLSMLDKADVPLDALGDSSGRLELLSSL